MLGSHSKAIKVIALVCLANISAGKSEYSMMLFKDVVLVKKLLNMIAVEREEVNFADSR